MSTTTDTVAAPAAVAPALAHAGGRAPPLAREFLPAALEVLETPASPAGRAVAVTIATFLVLALGWSIIGQVDIVATAPGSVIPAGKSKVVQPLEAGVVHSILVADGDHVRAGQVLFELDVTIAAAERDRIARELRQAELDAAGLRALQRDLSTGEGLASFAAPEGVPGIEMERTRAAIAARRAEQMAKLAMLERQIAGKQAELGENDATVDKLTASLPWLEQKAELRRQLLSIEFGNRLAYLDAQQALVEGRAALVVQQHRGPEIQAALGALVRQREQAIAEYGHGVLKELAEAEQKVGTSSQQLLGAAHHAGEAVLTSPIDGTVQQLAVHTVGGVVSISKVSVQERGRSDFAMAAVQTANGRRIAWRATSPRRTLAATNSMVRSRTYKDMASGRLCGQTGIGMKGIGMPTCRMGKARSYVLMGYHSLASGTKDAFKRTEG